MGAIVIAILVACALGAVGLAYKAGGDAAVAAYKIEQEAAQKKIEEQAAELREAEANKIVDMQAAYEAGESQSRKTTRTIYVQGKDQVKEKIVYRDPKCVIDADGVRVLNGSIADLRTAAAASVLGLTVPSPGPAGGRTATDGGSIPPPAGGVWGMERMREETPAPSGDGQGEGQSVRPRPKPTPVTK